MDYLLYIFWAYHTPIGSMIDMRLWHDKSKDAVWLQEYFDFWLVYWACSPFLTQFLIQQGMDLFQWKSVLIAFGSSVLWDLGFSKHEYGKWIVALPLWLIIPNPFSKKQTWYERRIVIGFTEKQMYYFNALRVSVLIGTLFI